VTPELVCIGLATADLIVPLTSWPDRDGRQVVEMFHRAGGGPAATAAVAAARLGCRVAFIGAVGDDATGAAVRHDLAAERIDVERLRQRAGRTAESVILLDPDGGGRSILHAPGVTLDGLAEADLDRCRAASWVHVDHAGWRAARDVPRERLSVDAGNAIPDLDLAGIGLYVPTEASITARYPDRPLGAAVVAALAAGAARVVVTMGAAGAMAADAAGAWRVGGVPGLEVASTLGAGDVFHGALLAGLIAGRDLSEALVGANVAAALSCRAIDGRAAIPNEDELRVALATAPPAIAIDLEQE
jgi:sulfofructose kinase